MPRTRTKTKTKNNDITKLIVPIHALRGSTQLLSSHL